MYEGDIVQQFSTALLIKLPFTAMHWTGESYFFSYLVLIYQHLPAWPVQRLFVVQSCLGAGNYVSLSS